MMDLVALPETEVCIGQSVCTPQTILEGLVAPRHFGKPRMATRGEGVEIVVTDAEGLSSLQSPQREELKESDSTENDVGHVLPENSVLSENCVLPEESEDPVPLAEDSFGPAMSSPLRHYIDGTVPDLLRSGSSPLRRRVSSPVSNTLKEVRREVELSRRRSLKLKAQVEKLHNRSTQDWTQQRPQVTGQVQSLVKLLLPLTDVDPAQTVSSGSEDPLDEALSQLQHVARVLALNHTKGNTEDGDSAVLQQALRDRDQAVTKKKAMERELLNSKTEMMNMNNQLLEAVQHRLELSLELEAWKVDFQLLLQQQVLSQQAQAQAQAQAEAEQSQKKGGLLGSFGRKTGKASPKNTPSPSPSPARLAPAAAVAAPAESTPKAPAEREAPNRWRVNWRGRTSKGPDNTTKPEDNSTKQYLVQPLGRRRESQFHTVSLD